MTRRYSDAEATAVMKDERALSLQLRLSDRLGDNGIVAIVIGAFAADGLDILVDTWLMSCRVLGRQVEHATLNLIVTESLRLGARRLIGRYTPSAKNGMVRDLYLSFGFELLDETPDGITQWALDLATFSPIKTTMAVARAGDESK